MDNHQAFATVEIDQEWDFATDEFARIQAVSGGNVRLYNQSVLKNRTEPVFPTPTTGMSGVLDHQNNQMTLGFNIQLPIEWRKDSILFGEAQSRVLITVSQKEEVALVNYLQSQNVPYLTLGTVGGSELLIDGISFGE